MRVVFYDHEAERAGLTINFGQTETKMCCIAGRAGGVGAVVLANFGPNDLGMVNFQGGSAEPVTLALVDLSDRESSSRDLVRRQAHGDLIQRRNVLLIRAMFAPRCTQILVKVYESM